MEKELMRAALSAMALAARHGLLLQDNGYAQPEPRQLTASDQRAIADAQAKRDRRSARNLGRK